MKILQAHNIYQQAGGEDVVVEAEKQLLEDHGHDVVQYIRHNNAIKQPAQKIRLLFSAHYSRRSRKDFGNWLRTEKPDIVHVHNFFPLITPAIFDACRYFEVPAVLTLHNYRIIYPNGLLMHNGQIDERPLHKSAYSCVKDKVYRDSLLQTAVVAHMIEYHKRNNTWNSKVDGLITFTNFSKSKFVEYGIKPEKLSIKPNFIQDQPNIAKLNHEARHHEFYVFVGRVSKEKGVETLIDTWQKLPDKIPLVIIGDGPQAASLREKSRSNPNIIWKGYQKKDITLAYIKQAKALLFPSVWYEGFPMTILEAFSLSTPVISTNIGSQAEIISDGYDGMHFKVGNAEDLAAKIKLIEEEPGLPKNLGDNARRTYLSKYTPDINYQILQGIYESVLEKKF
jgi:glycosyltransferase involved in cell wall biosynthesis